MTKININPKKIIQISGEIIVKYDFNTFTTIAPIKAPYKTILHNASIPYGPYLEIGKGINVVTGEAVDLIKTGIVDPVLVTKTALKNAASVASTIMSADCVISNVREQ